MKFQHMKAVDYFFAHMLTPRLFFVSSFSTAMWKNVCVGDVLRIHKDQIIPVRVSIYKTQINSNTKTKCLIVSQVE